MERLRLFPLRTVLFPGMPLSLQVFEPRYRQLVEECVTAREEFGVALIREGEEVGETAVPYSLGTTARISRLHPTRDGRIRLEARGGRRFRIRESFHDRPYLSADVEFPVDQAAAVPSEMLEETRARYEQIRRLRDTISGEHYREIDTPQAPGDLADAIGATARGLVTERRLQRLLETLDVRRRLEEASGMVVSVMEATHQQAQAVVAQRWARVDRRN